MPAHPVEENTEAKGFAQGRVARGKSGSWAHAPSIISWGTNPMENLSFTGSRNSVIILSPYHP